MPHPPIPRIVITLPEHPWPELIKQISAVLIDLAHQEADHGRIDRVRIDVPSTLADVPSRQYAALLAWFRRQHVQVLLLGSWRADVRLEVRFKKNCQGFVD